MNVLSDEYLASIPFPKGELDRMQHRKWILTHAPKKSVGAEIGVFRGHFSEVIAEIVEPKVLYLVDPWTQLGETFGWGTENEYTNFGKLTTQEALEDVKRRVKRFPHINIVIQEATAHQFLSTFNDKLDWVYLDAEHTYHAVLAELKLINSHLKPGGIIMGDDWRIDPKHKHHGVFLAVNDFVRNHPYHFMAAGLGVQWCIRKNPTGERE